MSDDVRQAARAPVNCPFCGKAPTVHPYSESARSGFWCEVDCANEACLWQPHVDSQGSIEVAIEEWNEKVRKTLAALASGERGEYERGVEDAAKCCDETAKGYDAKGMLIDGTVAMMCAEKIRSLAAPAENDAGRGE